jgi:hypothetical protein
MIFDKQQQNKYIQINLDTQSQYINLHMQIIKKIGIIIIIISFNFHLKKKKKTTLLIK